MGKKQHLPEGKPAIPVCYRMAALRTAIDSRILPAGTRLGRWSSPPIYGCVHLKSAPSK